MSEHGESYREGTPIWVDITVSDIARSQAFYAGVFGWDYTDPQPEFAGYVNALIDGRRAAGLSPPIIGDEGRPEWVTYLAVDDARATADKVTATGGSVVTPTMSLGPLGFIGLFVDPTGAFFGVWQSVQHTGADVVDQHGAISWNEVRVGDYQQGKDFYGTVFGLAFSDLADGADSYAMMLAGGRPVAGLGQVGAGHQPHWVVYFGVDDIDAALSAVQRSGGGVAREPIDIPRGRVAIASGPDGETLALLERVPAGRLT
jgi:uncharacterized protein